MKVRLRRQAVEDISEIGLYIARDNPEKAISFTQGLRLRCRELGEFPLASPLRPDLGIDIRVAPYRGYLLVYLVRDGQVEIVRILHGARDLSTLLE